MSSAPGWPRRYLWRSLYEMWSAAPPPHTVIAKYALGPMCFSFAATLVILALGWMAILQDRAGSWALERAPADLIKARLSDVLSLPNSA